MKLKKNIKFLLILSTILLFGKLAIADEVKINKYKIELDPKYKWLKNYSSITEMGIPLKIEAYGALDNNNTIIQTLEIFEVKRPDRYASDIRDYMVSIAKSGNKGGECKNKSEYYYFEFNERGFNCLVVRSFDSKVDLNINTDFPEMRKNLKALFNKNNIKIPKKMLRSDHIIAKSTGSTYWISFMINKEVFNGDEKNLINNWINLSLKRHKNFEEGIKIKRKLSLNYESFDEKITLEELKKNLNEDKNLLDVSNLNKILEEEKKLKIEKEKLKTKTLKLKKQKELELKKQKELELKKQKELELKKKKEKKNKLKNQNLNKGTIVDQLKELTELYESGALTKEQFEAAKKIVLGK